MSNDNELDNEKNIDNTRDPVARLRAADPASLVEPRADFADDVIERTLAEAQPEAQPEAAGVTSPPVDLGAERARRRPRWLPLVAVAASLAIVGGAGYGIGAARPDTSLSADGIAPPISLQGPEGLGANGAPGSVSGAVGAGSGKITAGMDTRMYSPGYGHNSFTASGLSSEAGTAPGFAFDGRSASNSERIGELAAALGVAGVPQITDGGWSVGPQDNSAPSLWVSLDGVMSFSYSNPGLDPWNCGVDSEQIEVCDPPSNLPAEDASVAELRELLVAVGRDPDSFELDSEIWEESYTRTAQAWPVINGDRVDQPWSMEITADGIFSVYGALADIVSLGDYDIVSEQEAFERLSDPRFGALMTAYPAEVRILEGEPEQEWVAPTEPPATPTAGTSISWSVNQVTIVSARLGLASQWQPNGSVLLVPAYELTDAEGGTWSVIAVADSLLDFAAN